MPRTHIPLRPNLGVLQIGIKIQGYREPDLVMPDLDESGVTYTEAPPSPDYVPGLEEPEQAPTSPDYVPGPKHVDDEIVAEDQPYAKGGESDPEEDLEEDDDEDPEEDPADYPADGGDDGDDEDEPSDDDEDEEVDIEANGEEEEEEEEHPALANSTDVALPTIDQAPSAKETEPFETDESLATPPPHPAYRLTARISILAPVPTPVWSDVKIPSPPLLVSSPVPVLSPSPPTSLIHPLGYRAAMIRLRAEAASTSHSLPLPPPIILSHTRLDAPSPGTPPLHLLSTDRREDRPEVTLPPRKRLGIALGPRYEIRESSSTAAARPAGGLRADYGYVVTMDKEIRRDLERDRMTEFENRVRHDTYEVYMRLDHEQSERQLMDGRLNMLYRDRRAHARTTRFMETEARIAKLGDKFVDVGRQTVISELLAADYRRQRQLIEALKLVQSYRDSRDLLRVLHNQSYQRRLVVVPRLCYG
ncbi:hypothetical protein Tco_0914243 [Tanacetum coccineum]